jgi:hypothetical protein
MTYMAAFDRMCMLGNTSLSRSNLPSGSPPADKASPEITSGVDKICWQSAHSARNCLTHDLRNEIVEELIPIEERKTFRTGR